MAASAPDPFTDETFQNSAPSRQQQADLTGSAFYSSQLPSTYPPTSYATYGGFAPPGVGFGGYAGSFYNGANPGYGVPSVGSGFGHGSTRYAPLLGSLHQTQAGGTALLNGVQEAMHRFARVSSLLEEVLRNLHLLFDGVFGLGYSVVAFYDEAKLWLAVKSGPAAMILRIWRRLRGVWRLLILFFCSPLAGKYSPVALALQIMGLVPSDGLSADELLEAQDVSASAPRTFRARSDSVSPDDSVEPSGSRRDIETSNL